MRIKLLRGKQKELINLSRGNLSLKRFAEKLSIKEGKLLAYFYEDCLISESLFNQLEQHKRFEKFIEERREDNWGRKKGGINSPGRTKKISFPDKSVELSEFYGIMLGDGNSNRTRGYKVGTYMIRIVGDLEKDKEYLTKFVKPLIERLFKIKVRIGRFKSNAIFIEAHSKELVNFLEKLEFKPGDKIKNNLGIPDWIKTNKSFLTVCLRGLYDTDGSVYKLTNQNCFQINFCNKNQRLLTEVRSALISLGIFPSKISKEKELYITKKEEIRKFLKLIGFNNPRHLCRLRMFNLS